MLFTDEIEQEPIYADPRDVLPDPGIPFSHVLIVCLGVVAAVVLAIGAIL